MSNPIVSHVSSGSSWVGDTLDGFGSWSLRSKAPYLLGILMLFDSWDSIVIAFTVTVINSEWSLTALQTGSLFSVGYGGQFVGALVFGVVAERFGRLSILRILVLIMSLLAVACAMAGSYEQLFYIRAVQGLAIGGALPVAICYINEIAPTETRGRFFGTFQVLMVSGFGLAALLSAWLIPAFGWRIMFGLGAIPLAILPFTLTLPESPRWLAGRGRTEEAAQSLVKLGSGELPAQDERTAIAGSQKRVPFTMLFTREIRGTSIVTALLWFLTSLVSFGLVTWIPSIYVGEFNIPVEQALRYSAIVSLAVFIIPVVLRFTIDHIGRRPLPMLGTAIGGIALIAMIFLDRSATTLLVCFVIVGQIGISVGSMVLWPYTAETYPTRVRSLALGTSSSIARAAAMMTPLLVGGILQVAGSITPVFLVFGVAAVAAALLWLFGTKETARQKMVD